LLVVLVKKCLFPFLSSVEFDTVSFTFVMHSCPYVCV
jgi:hypothetical protein